MTEGQEYGQKKVINNSGLHDPMSNTVAWTFTGNRHSTAEYSEKLSCEGTAGREGTVLLRLSRCRSGIKIERVQKDRRKQT